MTTAARRKGSDAELVALRYFRSLGFPAERLRLAGKNDEGDVAVQDVQVVYLFEVKATQKLDVSGFLREAEVEAVNYAKARNLDPATVWPLVLWKRRNQPVGKWVVLTTLDSLLI